jgi:hypothetical protein
MEALLQSGIVVNSRAPGPDTSRSDSIEEEQTSPPQIDDLSNFVISDAGAQKFIGDARLERSK